MIGYLGTGLLGSGFVRALRRRGEAVQVWNRSIDKAQPLAADGAIVCATAADAVRGASLVHVTVSDDAAVDDVLEQARPGFGKDVVIVDHTTTSPAGAAERVKRWKERGILFQHAPVFMGPQNALEGTGAMLASGDKALFDRLKPALEPMTGKLVYLGPEPGRAAGFKLIGNLMLTAIAGGLVDAFTLGKAEGIAPADVAAMFDWFNPGSMVPGRSKKMADGNFDPPSWTLAMARKDSRLMVEAAGLGNEKLTVIPAIAALMDEWIASGHSAQDWTIIAQDAVS